VILYHSVSQSCLAIYLLILEIVWLNYKTINYNGRPNVYLRKTQHLQNTTLTVVKKRGNKNQYKNANKKSGSKKEEFTK
jgi:hypothetical protein